MSLIDSAEHVARSALDAFLVSDSALASTISGQRTTCMVVPQNGVAREVDLSGPPTGLGLDCEYFFNIIRHLVHAHGITDKSWYVTYDSTFPLPGLDTNSVVFIYGDERALTPQLYEPAGLILKCYGTRSAVVAKPRPTVGWVLDRLRVARNRHQDGVIRRALGAGRHAAIVAKTLPFPLGYTQQKDLPLSRFDDRSKLLWFAGSLRNSHAASTAIRKRLSAVPKLFARQEMARAVMDLQARHPDWPIELNFVQRYQDSLAAGGEGYSEAMMDSKICVVPRGTTPETQRFFEAMRSGCIVISEPVPDFWFYRGAPALTIGDWRELPSLVEELVADPDRMMEIHLAGRHWWEDVCAPQSMARTIAGILLGDTTVSEVADSSPTTL